jgi:hypothetical protein
MEAKKNGKSTVILAILQTFNVVLNEKTPKSKKFSNSKRQLFGAKFLTRIVTKKRTQ